MPELPEIKISADYINENCGLRIFDKIYSVEKGNEYFDITKKLSLEKFNIHARPYGKELFVNVGGIDITVFMGMNGNWSFCETDNIGQKYIRLRFDSIDGYSLLLYGGYMGPKYRIGERFNGTKRGPDPTIDFEEFKSNVLSNLHKKDFDKPIYEVLLNQEYFNGVGNYIRSTILHYMNKNPFVDARTYIKENSEELLKLCKDVPLKSYKLNGGQLRDWKNPMNKDSEEFQIQFECVFLCKKFLNF